MITHTYGVHTSSLYGGTILLDPLLPPKKCPLDCVICPLGETRSRLDKLDLPTPSVDKVLGDLEENKPLNANLEALLIWGFGDPLLLEDVDGFTSRVVASLRNKGMNAKVLVHSSLIRVKVAEKLLNTIDVLVIPYLWYGEGKQALGWTTSKSFIEYLEALKYLNKLEKGKIVPELYVFRIGSEHYPSLEHLNEALVHLNRTGFENTVIKPLDRPSPGRTTKPSTPGYIRTLVEKLEERGIRVVIETSLLPRSPFEWKKVSTRIYNHTLRIPLRYDEIKSIYGDLGVIALNNMISRKEIVLIHWGGRIFYKAVI